MKLTHKVNHNYVPDRTDPAWAERVEREAERTTTAAARNYARAQERLAEAERKAEREQFRTKPDRKKVKRLWAAVEHRRQELLDLQRLMQQNPGGPQRHRPVPGMGTM